MQARNEENHDYVILTDEALKKKYKSHGCKTKLLCSDPKSKKYFEIVPVTGQIFTSDLPSISNIAQSIVGNCAFLTCLRSIVRRYPNYVRYIINDLDVTHVKVNLFKEIDSEIKSVQY